MKPLRGQFMKQNEYFHDAVMQYKSAAMPMATWGFQTTSETFQIFYL